MISHRTNERVGKTNKTNGLQTYNVVQAETPSPSALNSNGKKERKRENFFISLEY